MATFDWPPRGGGGVTSLNGETGAITLTAGTGIAITTPTSSTIQIASTSAGDVTIGAFGSTPNANGLSISGSQVLNMQPADATHPGGISVADWNTFNNKQAALTFGNFTDAGTDGIVVTGGTGAVIGSGTSIAQHVADSTHNGYLSSTDWTTFNNKQSALTLTNLTDVGTDGITITNGTGAVIGASPVTISQHVASASFNGYLSSTDWSTFNGKQASGNYITALTGGVTASGPGSAVATVVTNANLTGPITSVGNATSVAAQTGTGSTFVMNTAPTMTNPVVGTQTQGDSSTKAASTAYVDTAITNALAGVNPAMTVQAATTAASDTSGFTYNNGVSGVGAFFTGSVNTAVTIDGYTFTALGQRLLVKNDTQSPSGAFNGVYYVTQVQTAILAPILTRALDYNQPSDMNNTGAIPVENGTVNAITQWVLTTLVTTVGTSPLTFTKFSRNPADYLLVANNLSDVGTKATAFDNLSPMTTGGDIIYGGASGTGTRLANGSSGQFLKSNGTTTAPSWAAVTATAPNSYSRHTAQGARGSTNTAILTWGTTVASNGSDITYTSSATNGDSWTINTAGIYAISVGNHTDANGIDFGISLNSNQLTTNIDTITSSAKLAQANSPAGSPVCAAWTGYLAVNDVIRNHFNTDNGAVTNNGRDFFSIYRVI